MRMLERHYDELTKGHPDRTQIQPVEITAAARWFLEENQQEEWDFREDFPVVTPPFPIMWMEYNPPKTVSSSVRTTRIPAELESVGCMSTCMEVRDGMGREVIERDTLRMMFADAAQRQGTPVSREFFEKNERDDDALKNGREAKWIVVWKMYMSTNAGRLIEDMEVIAAYVDAGGQMITENFLLLGSKMRLQWLEKLGGSSPSVMPFLFATSLMHAKNVSLESVEVPSAIQRRRAKDGKPCLIFKTLQINPIRQQAKSEGTGSGTKRAMHIVRGHFKDYRNSGGLFGKYKGLYWWDMHVAGDVANGQVVKDYAIGKVQP